MGFVCHRKESVWNLYKLNWHGQAMEMTHDNQTAAAKLLGLTRAKFRVLCKQVR